VVQGDPGIGKTALLQTARLLAEAHGLVVLSARGSEFERDYAYGGVRQLFELWLASASAADRRAALAGAAGLAAPLFGFEQKSVAADRERGFATLHGLYWLAANLSLRTPLLLTVDDAHWLDGPSLRWLVFLATRLERLPIAVVVTTRMIHDAQMDALISVARRDKEVQLLKPSALTASAVQELAQQTLEGAIDERLSQACCAVTGGNPFYLHELLRSLRASDVPPGEETIAFVETNAPEGVRQSVLARLAGLPERCGRLAQLLAIGGGAVDAHTLATLMGVDNVTLLEAGERLAAEGILTGGAQLGFVHPIVRAAVYEDLPIAVREREHSRIARCLAGAGAKPAQVAAHLLAIQPADDSWAAEQLRAAGSSALAEGAAEVAVRYLRRAADELEESQRPAGLLTDLGRAEAQIGHPSGVVHLAQALERSTDVRQRALIALEMGAALRTADRIADAVEVLKAAIDEVRGVDRDLELRLESSLYFTPRASLRAAHLVAGRLDKFHDKLQGASPAQRMTLSMVALDRLFAKDGTAEEAATFADRGLQQGALADPEEQMAAAISGRVLGWADRLAAARQNLDAVAKNASETGSPIVFVYALTGRCIANLRAGNVSEAIADGRNALDAVDSYELAFRVALTYATTAEALLEYGDITGAAELVGRYFEQPHNLDEATHAAMLHSRALLALNRGDSAGAAEDLRLAGSHMDEWGVTNPTLLPWRSTLAMALLAGGERGSALQRAREEVHLARGFGAPRALGVALTALGLVEGGTAGIARHEEAVRVLADSEARLAHARALAELGAALRRANQRAAAREPLRSALDLADRCQARPLVGHARAELLAAGGRPRSYRLSGRDALTPSERRVAELAASGQSNREIAQTLFVTPRTVEMHLTRAYRKLDIGERGELAGALGASGGGAAAAA
jgi:DNA-binding CsgD family transcriptional regulator